MFDVDVGVSVDALEQDTLAYGPRVGPLTLGKILCIGQIQVVALEDGKPVRYTDSSRALPPAVRRFVAWRDGAVSSPAATATTSSSPTTSNIGSTAAPTTPTTWPPCAGSTTTSSLALGPRRPGTEFPRASLGAPRRQCGGIALLRERESPCRRS
jgi:hypothetical protein